MELFVSMTMESLDELGSIDYIVIEMPEREPTGELIPPLFDLVERRIIRILDVLMVLKARDGSYEVVALEDVDPEDFGDLSPLAGAASGILNAEDAEQVASIMQPDARALMLVFENLWSVPLATSARRAGGQLIARGNIPVQSILAALEAETE